MSTEPLPRSARRAAWAGFVGTFIEYYDFALYGVMTVYFAPLFFPADNPATSVLTGLAVFGAGFVARPLGGILFGRIGDRHGRRTALIASILLMGMCSTLVAVLPTYESIGMAAPVMLTLLRLGQGLSAGSEMLGSVTYVLESVPRNRRAFMASMTPMGALAGGTASSVVAAILVAFLGGDAMASYGWRLAFAIAAPLSILALVVRSRLEDSPEFTDMVREEKVVRTPLREVLTVHRRNLLIAGGVALAANGAPNVAIWCTTYLLSDRGLPGTTVFMASAVTGVPIALLSLVAGRLTDRFGHRKVLIGVLVGYVVITFPVLYLIARVDSFFEIAAVLALFFALSALVQAPAFTFIAERFPAQVRYTGANFGQNIGTVFGSGIAPFVAALLFVGTGSTLGVGIWVVGVCIVAFVALSFRSIHYVAGISTGDDTAETVVPGDVARERA
ncbi:major facilitator superfamily protein [Rhodococcus ruber BKS 20-38]|uniref:Major facilitator superfamily protein n=1 Tax=Rhodococcus ruber BKS 20-38 TaxID=1278076 RepID=M2YZ70_9NOCA|nr:major facilitator superfamily protein [Rhodococcus ruber BKS 20-38]